MKRVKLYRILLSVLSVAALVPAAGLSAQDRRGTVEVDSREDLLSALPSDVVYMLPAFTDATVVFASGDSSKGRLNICLVDNSVRFINAAGDTLKLSNAENVHSIMAGDTLLLQRNGAFIKRVGVYGDLSLCERRELTLSEPEDNAGYAGLPPTSTGKQVRVQSVDYSRTYDRVVEIPWRLRTVYVLDDGQKMTAARKSAYLRYFGDVSAAVKAYIKENKTDFTDREDLVALFQYCAERDMAFHGEQAKR